jgi:hypothetical protein
MNTRGCAKNRNGYYNHNEEGVMRKRTVPGLLVVMSVLFSVAAFAEDAAPAAGPATQTEGLIEKGCKVGKGVKVWREDFGHGMMMNPVTDRQLVATSDGGVVVLFGNKIMKYDKNLNLVKEAEIKIDGDSFRKMIMEKGGRYHCGEGNTESQEKTSVEPAR